MIIEHVVSVGDLPESDKLVLAYWNEPGWHEADRWGIVRHFIDTDDDETSTGWESWSYPSFDMCVEPTLWFELPQTPTQESEDK